MPKETGESMGLWEENCPSYSTTAITSEEDKSVAKWTNAECGSAR